MICYNLKTGLIYLLAMYLALPTIFSQEEHDYNWVFGSPPNNPHQGFGGTLMSFDNKNILLEYFNIPIDMEASASISDTSGNLLFYTSGCNIRNNNHKVILNGHNINAGRMHDNWCNEVTMGDGGYPNFQGILFLPFAKYDLYYIIHVTTDVFVRQDTLSNTRIEYDKLYERWEVTDKNENIFSTTNLGNDLTAVRHANGRDWWTITAENGLHTPDSNQNLYYINLITPDSVYPPKEQRVGRKRKFYGGGQATFSPDGKKYIQHNSQNSVIIFDFDRCEGKLYNPVHIHLPTDTVFHDQDTIISSSPSGVSVSPNNKYLYISKREKLFQFDLERDNISSSKILIDEYDGFTAPFSTTFFQQKLGPNGKIYMTAPTGVNYLHVIHKPNEKGVACDFEQHGVELLSQHSFSVPNAPHYNLLDLSGSICDTLGINSNSTTIKESHPLIYDFKVYPNPTNGSVKVESNVNGLLQVINFEGKIILSKYIYSNQQNRIIIEKKGIYALKLIAKGQYYRVKRVLVI